MGMFYGDASSGYVDRQEGGQVMWQARGALLFSTRSHTSKGDYARDSSEVDLRSNLNDVRAFSWMDICVLNKSSEKVLLLHSLLG